MKNVLVFRYQIKKNVARTHKNVTRVRKAGDDDLNFEDAVSMLQESLNLERRTPAVNFTNLQLKQ